MKNITFAFSCVGSTLYRVLVKCNDIVALGGHVLVCVQKPLRGQKNNSYPSYVLFSDSIGLSKSRNILSRLVETRYVKFCDDDIDLEIENIERSLRLLVEKAYDCDVLIAKINRSSNIDYNENQDFEFYKTNLRKCFGVASMELIFKTALFNEGGYCFDNRFGVGSKYPIGEESILMFDLYKAGRSILHCNSIHCSHYEDSSGDMISDKILQGRGACFYRSFGRVLSILYVFLHSAICSYKKKKKFTYVLKMELAGRRNFHNSLAGD